MKLSFLIKKYILLGSGRFRIYKQFDEKDCGPTCLRMICAHYGLNISITAIKELCILTNKGTSLLNISDAAQTIGFETAALEQNINLLEQYELPAILHWRQNHFVVLYKIKKHNYYIADPKVGLIVLNKTDFERGWYTSKHVSKGVLLLLSPTNVIYNKKLAKSEKSDWQFLLKYFLRYKLLLTQLVFGLVLSSLLGIFLPILTQSMVDGGINSGSLNFVYLVLIGQLVFFIGRTAINFVRSWILLHISMRVNIAVLSDFIIKIMSLPISFFGRKTTGDIMQRMSDQQRIESFLTGNALNTLFSFINLFVFTLLLIRYDVNIFFISIIGSICYLIWISIFLSRRREINNQQFDNSSNNKTKLIELINGIKDIKLNNSERKKRWEWEILQLDQFKFSLSNLKLNQYQQAGSLFINQSKNLIITFLSVKSVIDGEITLGGMMAIQMIVGQVSSPIEQIVQFIQSYQDASISVERINEINNLASEENSDVIYVDKLPDDTSLVLRNVNFSYSNLSNELILKDINLKIPANKITAIVGVSGSGKTTLLNLLLRYFDANTGNIEIGNIDVKSIKLEVWRKNCGSVNQDGFIFSDTLLENIIMSDEVVNEEMLQYAIHFANLTSVINELPFGLDTRIGTSGQELSHGQKQRLLIARAIYKNPKYLFFDEATNSLDAHNERIIISNLKGFIEDKTVVIIAHRLSTVKGADNIIVLEGGKIKEQGSHRQLVMQRGSYFELIKDQLDLGI